MADCDRVRCECGTGFRIALNDCDRTECCSCTIQEYERVNGPYRPGWHFVSDTAAGNIEHG